MNIKQMDQNNWVCYKFGEGEYYYGEVGLLDNSGVVHPKDNVQMAGDAKLVRHGFGIYIYETPEAKIKYEGFFEKGKKSGKGALTLKDGSSYEGYFRENEYHDNGVMKFANGDIYDGKWKKGRMDGPGLFKKSNGQVLKGSFKNNYLIDGNVLRNPFLPNEDYEKLKKKRKQLHKQYEKNEKAKNGYFQRIQQTNSQKIINLFQKSWKNNRIPLVTASEQAQISIQSFSALLQSSSKTIKTIDLRKFYILAGQHKYNYKQQVTQKIQQALKQGHYVVLNLDDSSEIKEFDEFFYPDIKQLYEPNGFNQNIWSPKEIVKPQVRDKIIGESEMSEKFGFLVWSKLKLSQQGISDGLIQEKIQKRFDSILPFIKIDLLFLTKKKEIQMEPQVN